MVSTVWGQSIKREVGKTLVSAELVRQAYKKEQHQKILKELEDLEAIVQGIGKITITAPLSAEDLISSVCINRIVQGYLQNKWKHVQYRSVDLKLMLQSDLDDSGKSEGASEEWLRRGLEIVVENAVEAMLDADSFRKQILVVTRLEDNKVMIMIEDTGPGIPVEIKGQLFRTPIENNRYSKEVRCWVRLSRQYL